MQSRIAGALLALAGLSAPGAAFAESAADAKLPVPLAVRYADEARSDADREAFAMLFKAWKAADHIAAPASAGRGVRNRQVMASGSAGRQFRRPAGDAAMTSGFGMRQHPILGVRRPHLGVDLAARNGAPVYATADGVVSMAGANGGYGISVALDHAAGMETRYGHLSRLNVAAGQRVRKGDVIGFVGSTGLSTGPHLHYETRVNGQPVDPTQFMRRK